MTERRAVVAGPLAVLLLGLGCATTPETPSCGTRAFSIDAAFDGAAFAECTVGNPGAVVLTIRPEDPPPINNSPWYAFRIRRSAPGPIDLRLEFEDGHARYWPKISADGETFWRLPATDVVRSEDGTAMELTIRGDHQRAWIAAQELLTEAYYDRWIAELGAHAEISVETVGESVGGRPIRAARSAPRPHAIVLLGRQHPPEVSGAIAMRHFVAALLAESPLARVFRQNFTLLIVPLMNPDGVARGHWRHNLNGVDLNRDWGPFTQPETQSVAALLDALDRAGSRVRLMLDFHATRSNRFYTQVREDRAQPEHFARDWLNRARARLPDYEFTHDPRAPSDLANTKNYFFARYGVASITYEVGDETERALIGAAAPVFAEEMMKLMLARTAPTASANDP